ncbi:hypothetical protein JWG41_17965, partial [Leptospira sp. 201903075]|nr:hypothetical protein [Leptospira chreensis]
MKAILDSSMTQVTDFLTKVRPVSVVRNIQIILVSLTLLFVTYVLSIPFFGQTSVNTDPDGLFSEGKIAPETI